MRKFYLRLLGVFLTLLVFGQLPAQVTYFRENFDSIPGDTTRGPGTYAFPPGWLLRNVDGRTPSGTVNYVNNAWIRREDFILNQADSVAISTSWYTLPARSDDWMWTPPITIPNAVTTLSWRAVAPDRTYPDGYQVRIMVAPDVPGGSTGALGNQVSRSELLFSVAGESDEWRNRSVSLAGYANQTVRIAFRNNTLDRFLLMIDDIAVTGPAPRPLITLDSVRNVTCNGAATGYAAVIVSGSPAPYRYAWSPSGGSSAVATGLAAGNYRLTVTDARDSVSFLNVTITEPAAIQALATTVPVSCPGGSDGSATVTASGGTGALTYVWSTGATTRTINNVVAGNYTCRITDQNGCVVTQAVLIGSRPRAAVRSVTLPANGTYSSGNNLNFTVVFDSVVNVSTAGGTPGLPVTIGSVVRDAVYLSGSGSNQLTFRYTVLAEDNDPDGVSLATALDLNGGLISNRSGCAAAVSLNGVPSASGVLVFNKGSQTITFPLINDKLYGDADFNPGATASSGLPVTYQSSNTAVAQIINGQIRIIRPGTATITATQPGDAEYQPAAPRTRVLTIRARPVTVQAAALTKTYGTADPALTYTVSPALIGTDQLTGALVRDPGEDAGTYAIRQGSLNSDRYAITYNAAALTITRASQTITWNQDLSFGCNALNTVLLTATSSAGLPISYVSANTSVAVVENGSLRTVSAGSTTVTATAAADRNHDAATLSRLVAVGLSGTRIVKKWSDVLVFDNTGGEYIAWQWYKDGVAIAGATGQVYRESGPVSGFYLVEAVHRNGSRVTTCPVEFRNVPNVFPLTVFPNPGAPGNTAEVRIGYTSAQLTGARLDISNLNGMVIQSVTNLTAQQNITLPQSPGLYIFRLLLTSGEIASVSVVVK